MLRSVPTRWFELLVAREDLSNAVETLAGTLAVELETHSETTAPLSVPDIRAQLEEYAQHPSQVINESCLSALDTNVYWQEFMTK